MVEMAGSSNLGAWSGDGVVSPSVLDDILVSISKWLYCKYLGGL